MDRYANSVLFGFDFQSNAAIVLMLDNMAEMETIRIDGEDDIEIGLNDGTFVLAQAKAVENASTDFRNVRQKAKAAMESLSDSSQKLKARKLVYITNSPNPFRDDTTSFMFFASGFKTYAGLPEPTRNLIDGWLSGIDNPLDTSLLTVQVLPFESDDEKQRYKEVLQVISDFIGDLDISSDGLRKRLHDVWGTMFDRNGSKKNRDIKLKKKDVVWPIIVFVTEKGQLSRYGKFCEDMDEGEFEEIDKRYHELIEDTCERFETVVKVISDYSEQRMAGRDAIERFINQHWKEYIGELGTDAVDESVRENLTKVILYTILLKKIEINKIKKAVKL